ncbi:hypothetical protein B0H14DRAFT_2524617 [Mycena olivaceomarginata]|nr:hypothetical protein B0H14DRAFT_2524617 [Mycena olivaceomarginata]
MSAFEETPDEPDGSARERCGVYHLVHSWLAQGSSVNDEIGPSADMAAGTAAQSKAVVHYFQVTYEFALVVSERFRGVFPDYHARYLKAFKAGCHLPLDDPGPFIGRAIVWKLQVRAHLDGLEAGPVGTTPEGGFGRGGLVFPDFAQYAPGDLCLCFAGALYHGVEEWEPLPVDEEDTLNNITPGRISTVFFFPEKSLATLEDKAAGWGRDTAGGLLPSDDEQRTFTPIHIAPNSLSLGACRTE